MFEDKILLIDNFGVDKIYSFEYKFYGGTINYWECRTPQNIFEQNFVSGFLWELRL